MYFGRLEGRRVNQKKSTYIQLARKFGQLTQNILGSKISKIFRLAPIFQNFLTVLELFLL